MESGCPQCGSLDEAHRVGEATRARMIDTAMAWPFERIVARYVKDGADPLHAALHERELKRFLLLCSIYPNRNFGMAGPVDELWHTFLLFTGPYVRFCAQVAGRFLHHAPASGNGGGAADIGPYLLFLSCYEQTFGVRAPGRAWPTPDIGFEVVRWGDSRR